MKNIFSFLSIIALFMSGFGPAWAQNRDARILDKVNVNGFITTSLLLNSCKVIVPGDFDEAASWAPFYARLSTWSGPCNARGLAHGRGVLHDCYTSKAGEIYCNLHTGMMTNGLLQGRVQVQNFRDDHEGPDAPLSSWIAYEVETRVYKDGCYKAPGYDCSPTGALQLQARYLAGSR